MNQIDVVLEHSKARRDRKMPSTLDGCEALHLSIEPSNNYAGNTYLVALSIIADLQDQVKHSRAEQLAKCAEIARSFVGKRGASGNDLGWDAT